MAAAQEKPRKGSAGLAAQEGAKRGGLMRHPDEIESPLRSHEVVHQAAVAAAREEGGPALGQMRRGRRRWEAAPRQPDEIESP